jgi:methylenetetrahydrofolate/methylenetetrahydromethanopterin dehydrogenase (NADP+)
MLMATLTKPTILVQLDTDPQPSVFDAVVAVDAGVDHLFRHGGVTPENVRDLVYGALFTRGPADLKFTAIFIGGSKVPATEAVFEAVKRTFFGPFSVSVLADGNGSNTTAAAAVLTALEASGGSLEGARVLALAATGPVGQRIARLLVRLGATVALGSRDLARANELATRLRSTTGGDVIPFEMSRPDTVGRELQDASIVINAGPPGVQLLPAATWRNQPGLRALIDLNAVPPLGIEGVDAADKGKERHSVRAWGALGVGGTKMKIHKHAIIKLFTASNLVLDAEEVLELGRSMVS